MTGEAAFWLAFYGAFAGVALWATCRDRDFLPLGLALAGAYVASNACWFGGVAFSAKPGIYTMLQVLVALAAFLASAKHRTWVPKIIVAATVLSICANIWFAAIISPVWRQIHLWEVTTNVIFAIECCLAAGVGIADGLVTGRFRRWPVLGRLSAQPHVARTGAEPRG